MYYMQSCDQVLIPKSAISLTDVEARLVIIVSLNTYLGSLVVLGQQRHV